LHIIGTERHEARRVDNQLRGRSGRQGDPGSSRFYLSLQDDLLRIFGSERIATWMERLGIEEGEPIEHRWITRAVENAQKRVEGQNFEIRKHLIEYDDVMNQQRTIIYKKRRQLLEGEGVRQEVENMIADRATDIVYRSIEEKSRPDDWDLVAVEEASVVQFGFRPEVMQSNNGFKDPEDLLDYLTNKALDVYRAKDVELGPELFSRIETDVMLATMDQLWKDHLLNMDHLKEGVGLQGYGQQDPLVVYKREAYEMFETMWAKLQEDVVGRMMRIQLAKDEEPGQVRRRRRQQRMILGRGDGPPQRPTTYRREGQKVGRNDPCPCGSGLKFKKCHGA
jgi:preprotein translocase subunit SecA